MVDQPSSPVALVSSDRGILIGASRTGKSTLAFDLLQRFRADYPDSRIMVCDTKPRWRAERLPDGTSSRRMYRDFVKGDTIPNAMALSDPRDWNLAWHRDTNPSQTVIVQRLNGSERTNLLFQTWCAERFFNSVSANRPSLIYFDEGHDFFGGSGFARGSSDIVQRCFRAGGEKGLTSLIGVQRPKGFNPQCLTETSYCAVFRFNYAEDMHRLRDMGWPKDVPSPGYDEPYVFRLWRAQFGPNAPKYRLAAPVGSITKKKG